MSPGWIPGKDPSLGWVFCCVQELLAVARAVGVEKLLCKEGRRNVGLHPWGKGSPIAVLSNWKGLEGEIPVGTTPWGIQVVYRIMEKPEIEGTHEDH